MFIGIFVWQNNNRCRNTLDGLPGVVLIDRNTLIFNFMPITSHITQHISILSQQKITLCASLHHPCSIFSFLNTCTHTFFCTFFFHFCHFGLHLFFDLFICGRIGPRWWDCLRFNSNTSGIWWSVPVCEFILEDRCTTDMISTRKQLSTWFLKLTLTWLFWYVLLFHSKEWWGTCDGLQMYLQIPVKGKTSVI